MHECRGGGLGCRGVDLRGRNGVRPQFCQTTREFLCSLDLAGVTFVHKCTM